MMSKGESGEVVGLKYILWVDGTSCLSSKCTYDLSFIYDTGVLLPVSYLYQ